MLPLDIKMIINEREPACVKIDIDPHVEGVVRTLWGAFETFTLG